MQVNNPDVPRWTQISDKEPGKNENENENEKENENENGTLSIPKGHSNCRHKSSAKDFNLKSHAKDYH